MNVKAQKFFSHKAVTFLVSFFAALAPMLLWACRTTSFIFVDKVLFIGFSQLLFWLMVANAVFATVLAALRWRLPSWALQPPKWSAIAECVAMVLTAVFAIVGIAEIIGTGEGIGMALREAAEMTPVFIAYFLVVVFAFFFPSVGNKKARIAILCIAAVLGVFGALFAIYPPVHYKFLSDPVVIDMGSDYSVVFATSAEGTGYVEYEYDGKTYKVYDESDGRINGTSTIHSVNIPYEHLNNNTYRVGSMRVFEVYAYGGRNGRTIESEDYSFASPSGEDMSVLCISDWHTRTKAAKQSIENLGEYSAVIMLGDAASCMDTEDLAAEYIVSFGGDITGGEIPVIFARGNHETRGAYAAELSEALGMDKFYYETSFGGYRLIVLDSAEDKTDDNMEYGGLADYSAYRYRMIDWFESLQATEQKTIVICHSPTIAVEEDIIDRAYAKMEELGASIVLSGHYHYCALEEDKWPFITYIDGGHGGGDFIASRVTFSSDGIDLYACNKSGEEVLHKQVSWDGTVMN